jgi:hypothetical protein
LAGWTFGATSPLQSLTHDPTARSVQVHQQGQAWQAVAVLVSVSGLTDRAGLTLPGHQSVSQHVTVCGVARPFSTRHICAPFFLRKRSSRQLFTPLCNPGIAGWPGVPPPPGPHRKCEGVRTLTGAWPRAAKELCSATTQVVTQLLHITKALGRDGSTISVCACNPGHDHHLSGSMLDDNSQ